MSCIQQVMSCLEMTVVRIELSNLLVPHTFAEY